MRRRSASPSTGSDTNKHVGSRRCTQGRAREACEAEMMRGATWRTHSLRVAIAGLLTRFDRVTSLTHPAPQRSAPVEGGPAGTCPFRAGLVPLWRLPLWKLPLWKLPLWGLPSWGRPWPNLKATRGQGGFGQRRLRSKAAWVRAIWVAAKPAGRSRANRPEPSALGRSSLRPELELVPKLAASLSKPIANPHRWTAH